MGKRHERTGRTALAAALSFLLLIPLPSLAEVKQSSKSPLVGGLLSPEAAEMTVRREVWRCAPVADEDEDIVLLTLGTKGEYEGEQHFHPIASLAFDRYFDSHPLGQWTALWVYGPSGAGVWSHLRAVAPIPYGRPHASTSDLERLEKRQHDLETQAEDARLLVPDPVIELARLEQFPHGQGFWGGLDRKSVV